MKLYADYGIMHSTLYSINLSANMLIFSILYTDTTQNHTL